MAKFMMHRHLLLETVVAATPAETANRTADSELSQENFDSNMIIILAALLCALICALGLNSMVRCVLRCTRRFGMETEEQAAARISSTGMKKSMLRKIPIYVYGTDHEESGMSVNPGAECPICLGEFLDGEKVRVLKCNHGYHVRCIDTWLGSHSSCPNCRHSLVESTSSLKMPPPPQPLHGGGNSGGGEGHVVVEMSSVVGS